MAATRFLCFCAIFMSMYSESQAQPCSVFHSPNAWDWGLGGGSAWVQYGNTVTNEQVITFMRSPTSEALKIYFHDASVAVRSGDPVPAFANFSFEAGTGASALAVDGVGILQRFQDGRPGLVSGNLDREDKSLSMFARVHLRTRDKFRFYIASTCYEIPVTKAAWVALRIVFSPQSEFNKTALRLNDVREGRVSLVEFSKR